MMLVVRRFDTSIASIDSDLYGSKAVTDHKMSLRDSIISFASASSTLSRYSTGTSMTSRRSSITSYNSMSSYGTLFDEPPKLVKTPWEAERSKRSYVPRHRRPSTAKSLPPRIFEQLPDEIYACILQQLEKSHFTDLAGSCTSCYMRDLYNLALTSRRWLWPTRHQLYSKIWISAEEPSRIKRARILPDYRIKVLRRTLRENPMLARIVKALQFPDAHEIYQQASTKERQAIINTLASLVMACPNLERFTGLYLTYNHTFDRLTHALSTRTRLRENVWVLKADDVGWDESGMYRTNSRSHDPLWNADNPDAFLHSHDNWLRLDTLCIFGQGTGSMDYRAFVATFRKLPALKHLLVSEFDAEQFSDRTLQAIPALRSLRLQDLPGLTEKGLLKFANSDKARTIRRLSFINLEITSAVVISKFMSNLPNLVRFTLVQENSPALPLGVDFPGPIYASGTLECIHWDILARGPANRDLAASIRAGALQSLRMIRAPTDNDGVLQALCRPKAQITLPSDSHLVNQINNPFDHHTLSTARRAAQQRLEDARREPLLKIIVEEDGVVQHTYTLRTYMGTLGSKIEYSLDSDVDGGEEAIAGLNDLLVRRDPGGAGAESFCFGDRPVTPGRKERGKPQHHRQRRIMTSPSLGLFF